MLDLKIFLFENKLSFIFKNFSFDLLLQSTFQTFIHFNKIQRFIQHFLRTLTKIPLQSKTFCNSTTFFGPLGQRPCVILKFSQGWEDS